MFYFFKRTYNARIVSVDPMSQKGTADFSVNGCFSYLSRLTYLSLVVKWWFIVQLHVDILHVIEQKKWKSTIPFCNMFPT